MKSVSTYISIGFFLFFSACDPSKSPKTETEVANDIIRKVNVGIEFDKARSGIQDVLEQQVKAWNEGNIDEFMTGYWKSDSLKFITKNGVRLGYDSVTLNYKKHYDSKEKMGTLSFTDLSFSSLDTDLETMNVTGKWKVVQSKETLSGIFSLIFRLVDNKWKIVIDHTW